VVISQADGESQNQASFRQYLPAWMSLRHLNGPMSSGRTPVVPWMPIPNVCRMHAKVAASTVRCEGANLTPTHSLLCDLAGFQRTQRTKECSLGPAREKESRNRGTKEPEEAWICATPPTWRRAEPAIGQLTNMMSSPSRFPARSGLPSVAHCPKRTKTRQASPRTWHPSTASRVMPFGQTDKCPGQRDASNEQ
jgi:hypothetical protein